MNQQTSTRGKRSWLSGRRGRVLAGLVSAGILSTLAWAGPAEAVANPVHAVPVSKVTTTRNATEQLTFNPSPSGSVNDIWFKPPPGVYITNATGCGSTAGLPLTNPDTYVCASGGFSFTSPITLTLGISSSAASGVQTGQAIVNQTDNTQVSDNWYVIPTDIGATPTSTPVTAPGATGTATFNPTSPMGDLNYLFFWVPGPVTITAAAGCPQASALPMSGNVAGGAQFVCLQGVKFTTPITLTYTMASTAAPGTSFNSVGVIGQVDGSTTTFPFVVKTPVGATKVTALHVAEPSVYGKSSQVTVSVARDGSTGAAPTGSVQLVDAAGAVLGTQVLLDGAAAFTLPATTPVGARTLTAKYTGSDTLAASQSTVSVTVNKAPTKTKAKASTSRPKYKADFKLAVTVKASGFSPAGKVKVTYKGKVVGKGTVRKGKATVKIKKDLKIGKRKLVVRYLGSPKTLTSKSTVKITVVR